MGTRSTYPDVLCQHCRKKRCNRPRGLCWTCYYTPGVRDAYEHPDPEVRKYNGCKNAVRATLPAAQVALAALPTAAEPGTFDKLAVLEIRAALKLPLFHPRDTRDATEVRTDRPAYYRVRRGWRHDRTF
jgi:hypothetical protein